MTSSAEPGPFEITGFGFSVKARTTGVWGERRRNRVSGKIGDMSFFSAIEW